MADSLQWEEISSTGATSACAIFLHGRGTNGSDLIPFARAFDLPELRFIFPHAPMACPDIPGGRMWFGSPSELTPGIERSRELLSQLIDDLLQGDDVNPGVNADQIFLLGFSQGAVMALELGLQFNQPLAGIAALSGFLAEPELFARKKSPASLQVPVLLLHGTEDQVVSIEGSRRAHATLSACGYQVQIREYEIEHQIIADEIVLLRSEIIKQLSLS